MTATATEASGDTSEISGPRAIAIQMIRNYVRFSAGTTIAVKSVTAAPSSWQTSSAAALDPLWDLTLSVPAGTLAPAEFERARRLGQRYWLAALPRRALRVERGPVGLAIHVRGGPGREGRSDNLRAVGRCDAGPGAARPDGRGIRGDDDGRFGRRLAAASDSRCDRDARRSDHRVSICRYPRSHDRAHHRRCRPCRRGF